MSLLPYRYQDQGEQAKGDLRFVVEGPSGPVTHAADPAYPDGHLAEIALWLNEACLEGRASRDRELRSSGLVALTAEECQIILQRIDGDTAAALTLREKAERYAGS